MVTMLIINAFTMNSRKLTEYYFFTSMHKRETNTKYLIQKKRTLGIYCELVTARHAANTSGSKRKKKTRRKLLSIPLHNLQTR